MLSQMFEQFYACVRNGQYLQFLENSIHFEFNFIPFIDEKKLKYEMQNYFTETETIPFSYRTLIDIISIPRTYIYGLDSSGKYVLKELESFEEAILRISRKQYQEIEFLTKANDGSG